MICVCIGEFFFWMVDFKLGVMVGLGGCRKEDNFVLFFFSIVGIVMFFVGLNVVDFKFESICGDEVECFRVWCCRMGLIEIDGELGILSVVCVMRFEVLVLRLS